MEHPRPRAADGSEIPRFRDVIKEYTGGFTSRLLEQLPADGPRLMRVRYEYLEDRLLSLLDQCLEIWDGDDTRTELRKMQGGLDFDMEVTEDGPEDENRVSVGISVYERVDKGIKSSSFALYTKDNGNSWDLCHRVVPPEYRGDSQNPKSMTKITMKLIDAFFNEMATLKEEPVEVFLDVFQIEVGLWLLKEGYLPQSEADRTNWNRMLGGNSSGVELNEAGAVQFSDPERVTAQGHRERCCVRFSKRFPQN